MREKEWLGESGYCNCLMVSMIRSGTQSVELVSNQLPPDLLEMTESVPETNEWIRSQEFIIDYLNTDEIIKLLMSSAKMKMLPWSSKKGSIAIVDVEGEDKAPVNRTFYLERSKQNGNLTLMVQHLTA